MIVVLINYLYTLSFPPGLYYTQFTCTEYLLTSCGCYLINPKQYNMNTISAIASFFKLSVQWFLPNEKMEQIEDHMNALRLSNIFFLCLLGAVFSSGTGLIFSDHHNITHLICVALLVGGGVSLKFQGNLSLATELCILAVFSLSVSFDGIYFVQFFWLFSASVLSFLLLGKTKALKKTGILTLLFGTQFLFQTINVHEFSNVLGIYGPFEFLMAFSLFLGLGFGMNRPKSILIDELLSISNEVCQENEELSNKITEKDLIIKSLERELKEVKASNLKQSKIDLEAKLNNQTFINELIDELED